jgi:hypothetical protein
MLFLAFLKQHHLSVFKSFVRKKGVGKEELSKHVCCLGIEEVHGISILINNSVLLA